LAYANYVRLSFIGLGKPVQNFFIESFNDKFRDECLNGNVFTDLLDARKKIEAWRIDYNTVRPHNLLNDLTPEEFIGPNPNSDLHPESRPLKVEISGL
jgi:putative transposase